MWNEQDKEAAAAIIVIIIVKIFSICYQSIVWMHILLD